LNQAYGHIIDFVYLKGMYQQLLKSVQSRIPLSLEEAEEINSFFFCRKVEKRKLVLTAGNTSQDLFFASNGLLRLFSTDDQANEHVLQFASEGWWIADNYSFLSGEPAIFSIEALEDSSLLVLTKEQMDAMTKKVPKMERYFRLLLQTSVVSMQRRISNWQSHSAEQKYLQMVELYPNIIIRSSQHHIASYLGITPETLSRVRKKVASHRYFKE
jgi:CRP-like cAMP-binding protein